VDTKADMQYAGVYISLRMECLMSFEKDMRLHFTTLGKNLCA